MGAMRAPAFALVAVIVAGLLLASDSIVPTPPTPPTTVSLNLKKLEVEVATDRVLEFRFSRPVDATEAASRIEIDPATDGQLISAGDNLRFSWTPAKGWQEATLYRVFVFPFRDRQTNLVAARNWTFITTVVPRVTSAKDATGQSLVAGDEIDQGAPIALSFNTPMSAPDTSITVGGQPATVTWSIDFHTASIATDAYPVGPLELALATGRDLSGHIAASGWNLALAIGYQVRIATRHLPFPALVQIPNDGYGARPQVGVQAAAMIFEYQTEGNIQRLTALYTDVPDVIGPVRSGRRISFKLTHHYHGGLFFSGLSNDAHRLLYSEPVLNWEDSPPSFYRDYGRSGPNNLMLSGAAVLALEQGSGVAAFEPIKKGGKVDLGGGEPASSFQVAEHRSSYTYDPGTGTFGKVEDGQVMMDASLGRPDQIFMVLVVHTREYLVSDIESGCCTQGRDFDLVSGGALDIYYKGVHLAGSWAAADRSSPLAFKLASGQELALPRGLVWVDVVGS